MLEHKSEKDERRHGCAKLSNERESLGEQDSAAEPAYEDIYCQTELICTDLFQLDENYRTATEKLSELSFSRESMKGNHKKIYHLHWSSKFYHPCCSFQLS